MSLQRACNVYLEYTSSVRPIFIERTFRVKWEVMHLTITATRGLRDHVTVRLARSFLAPTTHDSTDLWRGAEASLWSCYRYFLTFHF